MDWGSIIKIITDISNGGMEGIVTILVCIIIGLVWDRKRLQDNLSKKEDKIEEILDNYYKGNLTLTEALSGLKVLLAEIKSKL